MGRWWLRRIGLLLGLGAAALQPVHAQDTPPPLGPDVQPAGQLVLANLSLVVLSAAASARFTPPGVTLAGQVPQLPADESPRDVPFETIEDGAFSPPAVAHLIAQCPRARYTAPTE